MRAQTLGIVGKQFVTIDACNLYYSWGEILIRPLIPPSKTNHAFNNAKQRLFMSATLGNGGDLERLTGLKKINRIPIPNGWDKQGLGRRFFIFPEQTIEQDELKPFLCNLINKNERTVLIVSSNYDESKWKEELEKSLPEYNIFTAKHIENGKENFNQSEKSVVLLSNRFDGIDFKGEESRLLIIDKISNSGSLQEKFLQFKLNAGIIFFERNRTRLIQAIGRCTRSANDFAAVCILNGGISDWFIYPDKTKLFHPEIQGEIEFGIHQSQTENPDNLIENFTHFINQTEEWRQAESQIIENRDNKEQKPITGEKELASSVAFEVQYMYALWDKNYIDALEMCNNIISSLEGGSELIGYRAFWNYLAGCCAWLHYKETNSSSFHAKALEYFNTARKIKPSFGILNNILLENSNEAKDAPLDNFAIFNIENSALRIESLKIEQPAKFIKAIASIRDELNVEEKIEDAQVKIGELLGFKSEKKKGSATPDPYWISQNSLVIVFEDKIYEDIDKPIPPSDIRQALSHKNWIKLNIEGLSQDVEIKTVFLSNRKKINPDDKHTCGELFYWNYSDFNNWGNELLNSILSIKNFYSGGGDYGWKEHLHEEFERKNLFPLQILSKLETLDSIAQ